MYARYPYLIYYTTHDKILNELGFSIAGDLTACSLIRTFTIIKTIKSTEIYAEIIDELSKYDVVSLCSVEIIRHLLT